MYACVCICCSFQKQGSLKKQGPQNRPSYTMILTIGAPTKDTHFQETAVSMHVYNHPEVDGLWGIEGMYLESFNIYSRMAICTEIDRQPDS